MNVRRYEVSVTTDGSGDGTAYSESIKGRLVGFLVVSGGFGIGAQFTVNTEETGYYPVVDFQAGLDTLYQLGQSLWDLENGAAFVFAAGGSNVPVAGYPIANERLLVTVASGGANKTGTVILFVE